jgi:hypothetical protein
LPSPGELGEGLTDRVMHRLPSRGLGQRSNSWLAWALLRFRLFHLSQFIAEIEGLFREVV